MTRARHNFSTGACVVVDLDSEANHYLFTEELFCKYFRIGNYRIVIYIGQQFPKFAFFGG